ncbi:excalibur calcium-binding domain-containing protein [Marmoricola sp. URHB0036]|uniref:excalibur calcium-binding domain-containing protein n=1 Tax=Marmoricola sp. URHB0036 TaxID=1298863 RepID=UPI000400E9C1|nr:excalibur calcium-binding domain-containing protein [Marmoricola sp. URHB0036]
MASIAVAVVWIALTGHPANPVSAPQAPGTSYPTPSTPSTTTAPHAEGDAAEVLSTLAVKGRAARTGYDRASFRFGADVDNDGCDTRDDVLARDLVDRTVPADDQCETGSGTLTDPYSGRRIDFQQGTTSVDIDHVVALDDAWVSGAFGWDEDTKVRFANDPLNLLAVDYSLNRQKGSGDAATWLPPLKSHRCAYVARQIAVKAKYRLWVKPAERAAMERILSACPGQHLPRRTSRPTPPVATSQAQPSGQEAATPPATGPFANCAEARAAGAAPVHKGDPGYSPQLDGDSDGTGCED